MSLAAAPTITFPPELPVSQRREEIARAIAENQVVIVAGATGSGKTTQLPKICLELGRTSIAHTQPRRIAARSIAERVAEELGTDVGGLVGFQVRFTDRASESTVIMLMTDGILLNEIHHDRLLRRYDTIIVDEAHERTLNIDFVLGYLKQLLPRRPDLKVIITSATIDPESFARHFADASGKPAPVIEVSGRTYPVEVRYRPLVAESDDSDDPDAETGPAADDRDYLQGINDALDELAREEPGDVLVFLSGENEIRDATDAIRGRDLPGTEVLPLYGRLSAADQHRVFQRSSTPGIRRRVVLATNVAETSLTVPGIRYVIDGGTARISRYSNRSKVQRLPIEAVSQASAAQRAGRSGRTSAGIAIRLYSETDFEKRPAFTEPEILRTNLAAVILQMISLGFGDDIAAFPFLTPPDSRGVRDGLDLLRELGALTPESGLSRIGRDLARMPIEPRFARMVVESKKWGASREVLAIVGGLTVQDPRERPLEHRAHADQLHARFVDPTSDFITLLNLWNYLEDKQAELSSSAFRRLCRAEYVNYLRVREWQDVVRQLRRLARPLGLTVGDRSTDATAINRALLAGLLSHLGVKDTRTVAAARGANARGRSTTPPDRQGRSAEYLGARQTRFVLFPGSALAKKQPNTVMSAELVETSRLFARMNASVDPAWAESVAGDLCRRSYAEPHWEKSQGAAVVFENVTLFGVPIVRRRRVQLARVDRAEARELFIRHALVDGDWTHNTGADPLFAFERANRTLRSELAEVEERTRRRDILFDDEAVVDFYDARIPEDVTSTRAFERWWRAERREHPDLLTMTAQQLAEEAPAEVDERMFPPVWTQDDQSLAVSYRFEPGAPDDGVTVRVPLALLPRLGPSGFDWQVPGLRPELVTALIKALPKSIRRHVVPAADWARKLLAEPALATVEIPSADAQPFRAVVAGVIARTTSVPVSVDDFDLERVPEHLRITFEVLDERGRSLGTGKDLRMLQSRFADRARDSVAALARRAPAPRAGAGAGAAPVAGSGTHAPHRVASAHPHGAGSSPGSGDSPPSVRERSGITTWDVGDLPRQIDLTFASADSAAASRVRAYPALVDEGSSVALRVLTTRAEQERTHPAGVRRLLLGAVPSPVSYVQEHLTAAEKLDLATSPYASTRALFEDCMLAVAEAVLREQSPDGLLFSRADFESARDALSAAVVERLFDNVSTTAAVLRGARAVERALAATNTLTLLPALTDIRTQLSGLVFRGFVSSIGLRQLKEVPRYLAATSNRLAKLPDNPGRDRVWMTEVQTAMSLYADAGGSIPPPPDTPPNLVHARWLLEELRVSLFAQSLGTAEPASLQRVRKVLAG